MKTILCCILAAFGLVLVGNKASGQILLSTVPNATPYTQNFDTLPSTAPSTTFLWTNNVSLVGWYLSTGVTAVASGDLTFARISGGEANSGAAYSCGTNGVNTVADRALGAVGSGTVGFKNIAIGVRFTNDLPYAVTNITISYAGEQYRSANGSTAVTNVLQFSYRVASSAQTNADGATLLAWKTNGALDFYSPVTNKAASGDFHLDGNDSANRRVFTSIIVQDNVGGNAIMLPGDEIMLRWKKQDDSGGDAMLAIDDFSITFETNFTAGISVPVFTLQPANQTNKVSSLPTFTATATGVPAPAYQWYSSNAPGSYTLISGAVNPTLSLGYVSTNMSGTNYLVIATNVAGSATSSVAYLTVTNVPVVPTNIHYLHSLQDANFKVNDTNTVFEITGVVTTPVNLVGPTPASSFYIQDGTGGIDVFFRGGWAWPSGGVPSQGQLVHVIGSLDQFSGLIEFHPIGDKPDNLIEVVGSGSMPTPALLDFSAGIDVNAMEYTNEGLYMVISNVFFGITNSPAQTVAGGKVFATNLTGQTFLITIPTSGAADSGGQTFSTHFAKAIRGVITQVTTNSTGSLSNIYSMVWSLNSDMDILPAPSITTQPVDATVNEGWDTNFFVIADPAGEPLHYQWYTNDLNGVLAGQISSNIVLTAVTMSMSNAQYFCVVTNYAGVATSGLGILTVTNAGVVIPIPLGSFLSDGTNFVLTWSDASFQLQSSTNVQGPYVTIGGASSPYTNITTTNFQNYFRLMHP